MSMRSTWVLVAALVASGAWAEDAAQVKSQPPAVKGDAKDKPQASGGEPATKPGPALSEQEKLSYALGMDLASQFKSQSVAVNPDVFARGMKDALAGRTLLTEVEAKGFIASLQTLMRKRLEAERQAAGEKAKAEGEAFLTANKAKQGVVTLPSGLQYEILKAGVGPRPTLESTVSCHYRGTLVNGTEFDSSYARNAPVDLQVKGVIKGWTEALQLMPVGSRWRIVIPSDLAYGTRGSGPIPPNSVLVFELELLAIK